jgi:dienelactone hydrolase
MIHDTGQFTSDGKPIRVDIFSQEQVNGPLPAVLVIHGASALADRKAYMQTIASALASHGFVACFAHYFDSTGHEYATDEEMHENSPVWLATLKDAVGYMAGLPHVDPARLACFGFSLGGYLAIGLGAEDGRIKAVVELAGGVMPDYAKTITHMVPTLILHGSVDTRVPVTSARQLEALLTRLNVPHALHIYPGEAHVLSLPAITDVIERSVLFLQNSM